MTHPGQPVSFGTLRCGRLIDTGAALIDLATGLSVRLSSRVLDPEAACRWSAVTPGTPTDTPGHVVLDAWLTPDWLGRWVERVVATQADDAAWVRSAPGWSWPALPPAAIGVTRTSGAGDWCRSAAAARLSGLVPILGSTLTCVVSGAAAQWPPLLVGVTESRVLADAAGTEAWARRGGRVAALAMVSGLPAAWTAEGSAMRTDVPQHTRRATGLGEPHMCASFGVHSVCSTARRTVPRLQPFPSLLEVVIA